MSKIVKAQAGVAVRAIPTIAPALPTIGSVVSKVLPVIGGVPGIIASTIFDIVTGGKSSRPGASQRNSKSNVAAADATRVFRPVIVPTRRDVNLHLGQHTTTTKAMPVSRVRINVASAPVDTTQAKAGSTEAQRDNTETATGNTSSQNTGNTSRRRLTAKERLTGKLNETGNTNSTTPNTDNNPGFFRRNKKTLIGIGGVVGAPYIFNIGKKGFNTWIDAWGFRGDENKDKSQNTDSIQKQAPVQNDTTQAYNGFLINQQNLVE